MLRSAKNLQRNSCKYYRVKSTHPLRSATDVLGNIHGIFKVSIHAPLVEYDICFPEFLHSFPGFYPRTPRGVRQISLQQKAYEIRFYPRTPRGVRCKKGLDRQHAEGSYPRTPRGVRPDEFELPVYTAKFQSTHPSRSATDGV